jgi:hypothetical protein
MRKRWWRKWKKQRPALVKTETAAVALTVTAVEIAAAMANGDGGQNRVSGGSGGDSGYGSGR